MINRDSFKAGQKLDLDASSQAWVAADIADGYVFGTASTPSVDLAGHKVLAGAFDESIERRGLNKGITGGPGGVKLLMFHNPTKLAGSINKLVTVNDHLKISANLDLELSYVSEVYTIAKKLGGLSFSVGFSLEKFGFEKDDKHGEILVVEKGDLMEVSVVAFPAQPEATMDFIKEFSFDRVDTPSDFEKALIKQGFALNRNQAHKLMQFCRHSVHLFDPPMPVQAKTPARPMLDACQLKAASDQIERIKTLFAAR